MARILPLTSDSCLSAAHQLDGRERTTQGVFGPEGVTPLLGATTLQLFHLGVDPLQEQLVSVAGLLKPLNGNLTQRLYITLPGLALLPQ